jgi:hypothetical protein
VQVDGVRVGAELVAARVVGDGHRRVAPQGGAQPGQVAVQGAVGAVRPAVAPDPVDELLDGYDPVHVDEQRGEHAALPRRAEVDRVVTDRRLDRAEEPKLHLARTPSRTESVYAV